jgi:uncharacterized membrane protein
MPPRVARWTAVLLSVFAVTVAVLVAADVQSPVRAVLAFVFVMAAPGHALLGCCGLARGWLGAALVVATSASLATAIATAQLYLAAWSPTATVLVLALVTVAASAVTLWRLRRGLPSGFAARGRSGSGS